VVSLLLRFPAIPPPRVRLKRLQRASDLTCVVSTGEQLLRCTQ